MIYCDTSLLLSLYVADSGSEEAGSLVARADEPLAWTAWHELEFSAALAARVGRGATMQEAADAVIAELSVHRERDGLYVRTRADWDHVLERAVLLAKRHGAAYHCRSLDILHVASCLELGLRRFWSLDARQRQLAACESLDVNQ